MSLVSVIMPYYKKELYPKESIKSILNQIKKDKPLLIIKNNSRLNEISLLWKKFKYKKYFIIDSKVKIHKNQKTLDIFFISK